MLIISSRPPPAEARQQQLAVVGVSQVAGVRDHDRDNGPQSRNDLSSVVEPTRMGVAGGENARRVREAWIFLDREEQFRYRLIEAPSEEMRGAYHAELGADARARSEAQRSFGVLDRTVGPARVQTLDAADVPTARIARIECKGTVNQRHHRPDVLAEKGQRAGGSRQYARIVAGHFQGSPRDLDTLQTDSPGSSLLPSRSSRLQQSAAQASADP
jgi:hypothetical protein